MEVAARMLPLVQIMQIARGQPLPGEPRRLLLRSIAPEDTLRLAESPAVLDPALQRRIRRQKNGPPAPAGFPRRGGRYHLTKLRRHETTAVARRRPACALSTGSEAIPSGRLQPARTGARSSITAAALS